jgi:PqqD family protein of HPr-rel-A system
MIARPRRRGDLLLREIEEELLLFDPRTGEASLLNGTAAAIFELCDGLTPLAAMAEEILEVLSADPETVQADVQRIVEELARMGLIEEGG